MKNSISLRWVCVALMGTACGAVPPSPTAFAPPPPPPFAQQDQASSLFPGDAEVLSDSAIRRILAYELALPPTARVAVLEVGVRTGYRAWWSEETARLDTHITDTLLTVLGASSRVTVAAVLPGLLVPAKRTVPYLREAAARFQADILLLYQPMCGVFERSRFLAPNEYRVTCTVEAVALDTRSGIVPFTAVRTRSLVVRREAEDFDERDMLARGQFAVVGQAVAAVAEAFTGVLAGVAIR